MVSTELYTQQEHPPGMVMEVSFEDTQKWRATFPALQGHHASGAHIHGRRGAHGDAGNPSSFWP